MAAVNTVTISLLRKRGFNTSTCKAGKVYCVHVYACFRPINVFPAIVLRSCDDLIVIISLFAFVTQFRKVFCVHHPSEGKWKKPNLKWQHARFVPPTNFLHCFF